MKSQVLSNWDMPWLSSFALILFVAIFVVMLLMIFRKGSSQTYSSASALPLDEGSEKNDK